MVRPEVAETTALGAAYAAGLATGFWAARRTCARTGPRISAGSRRWMQATRDALLQGVEEGRHADLRLGRLSPRLRCWGGRARWPAAARHPADPEPGTRTMVTLSTDVLVIGGGATGAGSPGTRRCAGSTWSWWTAATWPRAPAAASTGCCTRAGATRSRIPAPPKSASPRTGSCDGSPPTASRTPAGCSSRLRWMTLTTPTVRPGLPDDRRRLRGDRRRAGAAPGAPAQPRDLARVPRPGRQHRHLEDGLGNEPRRPAARRADSPLPRRHRDPPRRRSGHRRPRA